MQERISDITILLGLDYIYYKYSEEKQLEIINSLMKPNNFLRRFLFLALLECEDVNEISMKLKISSYLARYINYNKHYRSGRCIICDRYFGNIKKHFDTFHFFTKTSLTQYNRFFSSYTYTYMPIEFKDIDSIEGPRKKLIKINNEKMKEKEKKKISQLKNEKIKEIESSKCFICEECGIFIPFQELKKHSNNHKRNEKINCEICEEIVKRKNMWMHKKTCNQKK